MKDGPAWKGGLRDGTQVQHAARGGNKNDTADIGRKKVVTFASGGRVVRFMARARGGAIEASNAVEPATKLPGGSGGGEGRLAKERRASRDYKKAV
jgi:hypothetical protein